MEQAAADAGEEALESHVTNVVAWGMPSAIVAGERFRMKLGVKCSRECDLTNTEYRVADHRGTHMAAGQVPAEYWPGTNGLHVAEVELEAPAEEGLYTWTAEALTSNDSSQHHGASISFGVRVVARPEYLVIVETVDRVDQTPLRGARVVMHPYRAIADDRGIAEVRVAKGAYKLFVSQTRYVTLGLPVEVTADMTARAELDVEAVTERN